MAENQEPASDAATIIILYGGTGDLAKRLVLPAFWELHTRGLLPKRWRLVTNGRGQSSHEDYRTRVRDALTEFASEPSEQDWPDFGDNVLFAGGGFREDDPGRLLDVLGEARAELGDDAQIIHYLAIPPSAFEATTRAIKAHDLAPGSKAVYEKPFGTSLESFHDLDALVHEVFDEEQVYRIDHFLGKEATQNLHLVRFSNRLFDSTWNADQIAQVQIDVPETLDVADRADFYDETGAALDMLVTHLFQVAAEVAMEPPTSMKAEDLQAARESVIAAFRPLDPADVVLGQYRSYRDTEGVAEDSQTDTYVAAKLWIDTDRWQGVPFLMRTGKKLARSAQRVSLIYKPTDGPVHPHTGYTNALMFDLKGNGAIEIQMTVKKPGPDPLPAESCSTLHLENVSSGSMTAYTSLIYDVFAGDRSLFTSSAGLDSAFKAFAPLLGDQRPEIQLYDDDSWGPEAADALTGEIGWLLAD